MMGHGHALSGAVVWLALAPTTATAVGHPLSAASILGGTLACAGAALAPDVDHPSGTISHFFGPISHVFCRFVSWASGGHRGKTHSLGFCVGLGAGVWAVQQYAGHMALLAVMLILTGLAMRALGVAPPKAGHWAGLSILLQAALVVWVVDRYVRGPWVWLGPAVALGSAVHLFGDMFGFDDLPLFFPLSRRKVCWYLFHAGKAFEVKVLTPLLLVAVVGLSGWVAWPLVVEQRAPARTAVTSGTR
jgi:membrane-bound metal-dependent hydrolase YbcI (DUF457 family)